MIDVMVAGAHGRMGKMAVQAIENDPALNLIATATRQQPLINCLQQYTADVIVDLTLPDCVYEHSKLIIDHGIHPVIGATGLSPQEITQLQQRANQRQLGGVIAPNFSLGAALMNQMTRIAAQWLPDVEIIEMHHAQKIDAPSGTAQHTANTIQKITNTPPHIHSVRLPGLLAHQRVIFGQLGETLTIKHDVIDRQAMRFGLLLAIKAAPQLNQLVYGLEHLLQTQPCHTLHQ